MLIVARTLSVLSVLLTVVAIETVRLHYLPIGFEATGVVAGYSVIVTVLFSLAALVIVIVRARSGSRTGHAPVVLLSTISLLVLAVLIATCPFGC